jgi:hypothetical protein
MVVSVGPWNRSVQPIFESSVLEEVLERRPPGPRDRSVRDCVDRAGSLVDRCCVESVVNTLCIGINNRKVIVGVNLLKGLKYVRLSCAPTNY